MTRYVEISANFKSTEGDQVELRFAQSDSFEIAIRNENSGQIETTITLSYSDLDEIIDQAEAAKKILAHAAAA